MVRSHLSLRSLVCLGVFGGVQPPAAATALDAESPKRHLRVRKAARQTNGFVLDDRIPIPVGSLEESHESGRMLFNIDVKSTLDTNGPVVVDRNNNGSAEGLILPAADESDVQEYIVNGHAAPQQTWFALTMEEYNGQFYQGPCGATMISREWALTAAHCISYIYKNDYKNRLDYLYVGAYQPWTADNYGNGNAGRPYEIIRIAQHIEHWNHKPGLGSKHDIALLRLERPVSINFQGFRPMEIGTSEMSGYGSIVGNVYGFGSTYYKGRKSAYLQQATLPYVDHNKCQKAMGGIISDDMICFGGDGKSDICQGDSGGPAIVNNKIVGVVSWGRGCNSKGYPSAHSSVVNQMDFINQVTGMEV